MKTRLIQIGNSRGVRLPKALIEAAGLGEVVDLAMREGAVIITKLGRPRDGWADAAALAAQRGEGTFLDPGEPTRFDAEEWDW